MSRKVFILLASSFLLCACATSEENHQSYLKRRGIDLPTNEMFQHCYGYGCKYIKDVSLKTKDWKAIEAILTPLPQTPEDERQKLSQAIGVFESRVGAIIGTDEDTKGTFRKFGTYQHDCVDESTNTTTYLLLLQNRGLLQYHRVESPTSRIPFIHYLGRWPHQTAVISEKHSGQYYAVDSWFHDNGSPAEIVSLDEWKDGWKPEDKHGN